MIRRDPMLLTEESYRHIDLNAPDWYFGRSLSHRPVVALVRRKLSLNFERATMTPRSRSLHGGVIPGDDLCWVPYIEDVGGQRLVVHPAIQREANTKLGGGYALLEGGYGELDIYIRLGDAIMIDPTRADCHSLPSIMRYAAGVITKRERLNESYLKRIFHFLRGFA